MGSLFEAAKAVSGDVERSAKREQYVKDPVLWAKDALGVHLWSKQREIVESVRDNTRTAVRSSNGIGKALALDTPLPTPTGWTTMGDVRVGDYLLDEAGKPTMVTYKSPIHLRPSYRVTFNDGAVLDTCEDHIWSVITEKSVNRHQQRVGPITDYREVWGLSEDVTTKELATMKGRIYVPNAKPLDLPEIDLPVDPYILGAWLGDGASSGPMMTVGKDGEYIVDEFAKRGVSLKRMAHDDIQFTFARQGYYQAFRELGVLKNKHIPEVYLRASYRQRLELLRGLMDTDGFHIDSAISGIDLTNERLALGVAELVRTLGSKTDPKKCRTYLNGRDVGPRYRMNFNTTFNPFTETSYKGLAWTPKNAQAGRKTVRLVKSVEEISTIPTQCVTVDSERSLYLASERFVPTHNTESAAVLTLWFLYVHLQDNPDETLVVVTAPSFPQIKTNVFAALKRLRKIAEKNGFEFPGRINDSGNTAAWKLDDGTEIVIGRRPPDNQVVTSFQGIHRLHTLVVIDEAGGVPRELIDLAERITSGGEPRILAIGNPDRIGSEFYHMFGEKSDWYQIHISTFDTPNFTGEEVPKELAQKVPSVAWAERQKKKFNNGNDPRYQISVLGEFPDADDLVFFPQTMIETGLRVEIEADYSNGVRLGVDLARFGDDSSVIYAYIGGNLRKVAEWSKANAVESANNIHQYALEQGATLVQIDAGGLGGPIIDNLETFTNLPYDIVALDGSKASSDPRRWMNLRAEWYEFFRTELYSERLDLDAADTRLLEDMRDINYEVIDGRGHIKIESKKDLKKRTGKSPDYLDAAIYAVFDVTRIPEEPSKNQYEDASDILDDMPNYLEMMVQGWMN